MNIPCAANSDCTCDNLPLTGYNADIADVAEFMSTAFVAITPPLGTTWTRYVCQQTALSPVSLQAAQLIAQSNAMACALGALSPFGNGGTSGGGGTVFFNAPQQCTVTCPDGLPFTFSVAAGLFSASSQSAADAAANSYACQQAAVRAICLSDLTVPVAEYNQAYFSGIFATGGSLAGPTGTNLWQIVAGGLPPGITFHGGNIGGNSVVISGTPTAIGTYSFTVSVTDPLGDVMTKQYVLPVNCPVSAVVTNNTNTDCHLLPHTPIWQKTFPDSGYDTGWIISNVGGSVACENIAQLNINFSSQPTSTWNWKLKWTFGQFVQVTVNGVLVFQQSGGLGVGSTTGTFSGPADCTVPVQVVIEYGVQGNPNSSCTFEWATPPS